MARYNEQTVELDYSPLIDTGYSAADNAVNDAAALADTKLADINAADKKASDDANAKAIDDANAKAAADAAAKAAAAAAAKAAADKAAADKAAADLAAAKTQAERQNAIAALTAQFNAMGLGADVAAAITAMVQQGYTADTISLIAQDPTSTNPLAVAMQTRFAGNAARIKAGLAPLSPAEYLATERSYRQVLSSAGLPSGFYDQTSDFTKFISQDISPTELKSRVDLASDAVTNADPFYRQSLQQQYGLSTGDMIAHVLDPSVALPILQKQAAAVSFGAEAQRQGLVVNNATAMLYGAQNISQAQAAQGFKTIAEMLPSEQALASRYTPGAAGNQMAALTADVFGGPNAGIAAANLKRLSTMETSAFGGSAGASQQGQSLGIGTQQGVQ